MLRVVLIFFAFTASSAVLGGPTDRIYNGQQVGPGEFPFVVSITVNGAHVCGGFIYNEKIAITAASCVYNVPVNQLNVVAGELSLISPDPDEQIIPVRQYQTYDKYDPVTKLHDIAIVELARPYVFSENVAFIRYEAIDDFGDSAGVTMGWGATQEGALPYTRLRKATVTLFDTNCLSWGQDLYDFNYMLCVGVESDNTGPCHYDEGAPVVQKTPNGDYVIGIMSKSKNCGTQPYFPALYTRLSSYYDWLFTYAGQQPNNGGRLV